MPSHGTTTPWDILLAVVAVIAFLALATWQYKAVSRALEGRGKPKWHAFFGWASLLEIAVNRARKVRNPQTDVPSSVSPPAGEPAAHDEHESDDAEHPTPVTPKEASGSDA